MPETLLDVHADLGFPGHLVLEGLRLTVARGEGVGLAGRNGSGKTTLLRTVAGLMLPRSGHVLVGGQPAHRRDRRLLTGFVPDPPPLYEELTPWEHLELVQRLWGGAVPEARLGEVSDALDLGGFLHQRCDTMSLGMRKRLGIALALAHRPSLLLLDEPFNGLDRETTERVRELLGDHLAAGGAFLASSHQAEVLAGVVTRTVSLPGREVAPPRVRGRGRRVVTDALAGLAAVAHAAVAPLDQAAPATSASWATRPPTWWSSFSGWRARRRSGWSRCS